jgi:hypothetical protein
MVDKNELVILKDKVDLCQVYNGFNYTGAIVESKNNTKATLHNSSLSGTLNIDDAIIDYAFTGGINILNSCISINESDASLHVDLVQEAKTKIDEIVTAVGNAQIAYTRENEDGESETILKIPKSIGTTKFPKTYGDPDHLSDVLITPFDEEEYFVKLKERLKSEGKSLDEINDILKKLDKS